MGPNGHCLGCGGEGQSWEEEGVGGTGDPGPALAMPLDATAYTRLPGGVGGTNAVRQGHFPSPLTPQTYPQTGFTAHSQEV